MSNTLFHVAVVGTGASGTLVAAQFKRLAPQGRLVIIGNEPRPARGVAYSTTFQSNLLNVPAGNMSAFPHDMSHFTNWLIHRRPHANASSFAKRELYGEYLAEIFDSVISDKTNTQYIRESVTDLSKEDDIWTIQLSNGDSIQAQTVVLAFGNFLPPNDPIDFGAIESNYYRNPWLSDSIKNLDADAPVLLLGTGLTSIDVALSLRELGHRGIIHAISRRGRLYLTHKYHASFPLLSVPEDFKSPLGALRWIRSKVENLKSDELDWRSVIDSLRPHTATIWQSWSIAQKKSFLRHARNLWDIHRHRIAPKIAEQLNALLDEKTLQIHSGHLISATPNGLNANIRWQDANGEIQTLTVTRVINCTGPSRDYSKIQSPLIRNLRKKGFIVPDELRLGFETDSQGRFVDSKGESVQGLFTLGPTRIPALWESIAIPEIREQALNVAELIISETIEAFIPA